MSLIARAALVVFVALGLATAMPAQAQAPASAPAAWGKPLTIKDFDDIINGVQGTLADNSLRLDWYLWGLRAGMGLADGHFEGLGVRRLICVPPKAMAHTDDYADLIDDELTQRQAIWMKNTNTPIMRVAVEAMRRKFPCR